jgi:hypothetical protein
MTSKEERAAKAKRAAIRRARERGEIPWPAVCECGRKTHSNAHDGMCTKCWLKTPEGKKYASERQKAFKARRRQAVTPNDFSSF